jgi:hypothetical protein
MKKLHGDGILESFDFESIDGCEKFLEMIETPFKSYWKETHEETPFWWNFGVF